MYIGAARIEHDEVEKYLVEAYFPYGSRRTYLWELVPSRPELLLRLVDPAEQSETLDMSLSADVTQAGYFMCQVNGLTEAYALEAYELKLLENSYTFQLPQLQ